MAGGGLKGEKYRYKKEKQVARKAMEQDIRAWVDSMVNVNKRTSFYFLATKFISARLINISAKILNEAVKRCPYDSTKRGSEAEQKLRSSGEVTLIAGAASGMDVVVKTNADKSGGYDIVKIKDSVSKGASVIELSISFDKQEKGMDLALWAHEELLRYVKRPKSGSNIGQWHATHHGTGPKYLENAFKLYKAEIPREVRKGLLQATTAYNKKHKTRARRR